MGYPTDKGPPNPEAYNKLQQVCSKLRNQLKEEQDRNHKQYQDNKTMRNLLRYELEKELLRKMAAPATPTNPWELPNWASTFSSPATAPPETPSAPPQFSQAEFFSKLKGLIKETVGEELVGRAIEMTNVEQKRAHEVREVEHYLKEKHPDIANNPGIFQEIWKESMNLAPTLSPKTRAERLLSQGGLVEKAYSLASNPYAGAAGFGAPNGGFPSSVPSQGSSTNNLRPEYQPYVDLRRAQEFSEGNYREKKEAYEAKQMNFRENPALF